MTAEVEARIDAVRRFVAATQGEAAVSTKVAALKTFGDLVNAEREVAAALPALRKAMAPPAPPRAAAAPAPQPQAVDRVSEEQYAKMDAGARLAYARRFPQWVQPNRG